MTPAPIGARGLRPIQLFNLAFGVAIGIGWIMVMGVWLDAAGPLGAALAFLVAGLAMLAIGHSYAAVAMDYQSKGGEFGYAHDAFGRKIAFWVGWFLALAYVVVIAFEIVSLAWISRALFPALPSADTSPVGGLDLAGLLIGFCALTVVVAFNFAGARSAARLQDMLVLLKILLSFGLIAGGLILGRAVNFEPAWGGHPGGSWLQGVATVLAMAPFFFAGFGVVAQALGEANTTPASATLPRVMAAIILGTMLFYILVILAAAAAAPRQATVDAAMPAAAAFSIAFGSQWGARAVLLLGLLGLFTIINGLYFAAVRLVQALGAAAVIPSFFGRAGRRAISPHSAIFVALTAAVLALLGKVMLVPLVNVASTAIGGVMAVVCAISLRGRRSLGAPKAIVPALGMLLATAMAVLPLYEAWRTSVHPVPIEWLTIGGWIVVGIVLAWAAGARRAAGQEAERGALSPDG